jgi:hypothetical protein
MNTRKTYLAAPPPVPSVHFVIQTLFFRLVNIMLLGGKNKSVGEFQVSIEFLNTFHHISEVDIK